MWPKVNTLYLIKKKVSFCNTNNTFQFVYLFPKNNREVKVNIKVVRHLKIYFLPTRAKAL